MAEFDIDQALALVAEAVRPYPPAALFQLAAEGYNTPFEQLVACIISIRTYDEVTIPTAHHLFAQARTPQQIAALTPRQIAQLIQASTFAERKAGQIHTIAQTLTAEYHNQLPCERELILSFHGVGPKCANLTLGIACGQPAISVDTHVHRITNRWGYVHTKSPEQTMAALEAKLPQKYWLEINRLLVPFGKHICQPRVPRCTICPLFAMCPRLGVRSYR